jgi:RTX calcium-binding nonapeptide repeat (4 copies)
MAVSVTYAWNFVRNLDLDSAIAGADVTSLANGGFAGLGANGGLINGTIFNSTGARTGGWSGNAGIIGALDQLSNGNIVIVSEDADSILFKVVSSVTGAEVVATVDLGQPFGFGHHADVAALAGGGFWIVDHTGQLAPAGIGVHIRNNDGTTTGIANPDFLIGGGSSVSGPVDASIAALDGGGVAVAWQLRTLTGSQIWYAVYTATGGMVSAPVLLDGTVAVNVRPSVCAMNGGGFAMVYEDDRPNGDVDITLGRFTATGAPVGFTDVSQNSDIDAKPYVTRLSNGMLAVGFQQLRGADNDDFVVLVDPNNGAVLATRTVTSGQSILDEVIDVAVAGFGLGQVAAFHTDVTDNDIQGEALQGVRISSGDGAADIITGDDFVDVMFGNGGADTLSGLANNDALVGGGGGDTAFGGAGNDTLFMDDYTAPAATNGVDFGYGDAGNDLVWGYGGNDTLYGGDNEDSLVGNDFASSVAGFDLLFGGNGNDQIFIGLGGNAYAEGGAGNDTFFGGTINDTLRGGLGSDYLYGNTGADFFLFYQADFAANDADIVYFVNAGDRLKFSASMNGALFFQNLTNLQYDSNPAHVTTGVYITAFLAGGATAHVTVYGTTVAALTPMVEYTL